MKALRNYLNRIKPNFEPDGKLHAFRSVFDGFETFLYTPNTTSTSGVNVHDSLDSKRVMIIVVLTLMPCLLFGMYNTGYQNWLAAGAVEFPFWQLMAYGFLAVLPRIVVAYVVGLGIEFVVAQWRREEIQEGFLVTGILIPLVCPIETPLWMIAVATAFSVIFVKEVFGGTGYNVFNVALVTRAVLFFGYPAQMSGDKVFVSTNSICGLGFDLPDGFSGATPLGQIASFTGGNLELLNLKGNPVSTWDAFLGLIPGSFGETSTLAILIGALLLLATGIASWRIMLSVVAGGLFMGWVANVFETPAYPASFLNPLDQLLFGGFAFAAVFMATDPVTAARTNPGKYIYGFLVGAVAIIIRTYNNGYPEGAMLAVLLGNALAPLIDYCVVQLNVSRRIRRQRRTAA
ncbi:NADH:ubiquinone reductase (Na(+)-transporting) subunit B [uncultured Duncaniella sp.]|jgi:Na+-transporting NADH:ubiquinone oxidoreductase subunit B|uniref:NADH:ubiquinone reductase (Na(+)-transporting) subunit B n=1 Tax=uncultured Duncaniella sp. TaxID=2768039 RepID=UPI000F4A65ED|nr:NADH:ubiquinone reductase (Na(+)-transporting) subunit B [uncultured Duncaniella sp.]ROS88213.1 NADH:ubiquinone reductase (Na(+)-transporting) subunit B [Muribaculaceae bacterium Isolate-080 (Janvier)]